MLEFITETNNMNKHYKNKSFVRDILRILRVIALFIAVFFIVSLNSNSKKNAEKALEEIEVASTQSITTPVPKPTEKPTATPVPIYIPDPEKLQEIPDIDTLEISENYISATEKITLNWEEQEEADYYLLCILDDDKNIIQKEILWSNITEWEIANFDGSHVLLLCYEDMGQEGTDDDILVESYMLDVKKEEDALQQMMLNVTPEDRYLIIVDKEDFSFAVLTLDEDMEYTRVVATFPCALGRSTRMTPTGRFKISSKGDWKEWQTGEYSPYYTRFTSGLYIHGALYSKKTYSSMIGEYYERIGTNHTSGCIRTTIEGARWIYYNCPAETVIKITASSDLVDRVERPEIDPDYPRWDPTDPNKPSD